MRMKTGIETSYRLGIIALLSARFVNPAPASGPAWPDRSVKLGDRKSVELGPILDRFLAAGQRLGDRLKRYPFLGEGVEFLNLIGAPRLAVSFELFGHGTS